MDCQIHPRTGTWRVSFIIDKDTALFFVGQNALCHKALDQGLYGFWAPAGGPKEPVSNLGCADGGVLPYDFHNLKFSL